MVLVFHAWPSGMDVGETSIGVSLLICVKVCEMETFMLTSDFFYSCLLIQCFSTYLLTSGLESLTSYIIRPRLRLSGCSGFFSISGVYLIW